MLRWRQFLRPLHLGHRLPFRALHTAQDAGLSPVLLTRARLLAAEHTRLTDKLSDSFDTKVAKRAGELASVTAALRKWENANEALQELKSLLHDDETDEELRALAMEDLRLHQRVSARDRRPVEKVVDPPSPFRGPSIRGLRPIILKQDTEDGQAEDRLTEAVIEIEANGSYDIMRTESGVHRVQRVPATETKGRTHTSAVSVMVLPSFPDNGNEMDSALNFEDPTSDYYIDPQEVRVEKMRAGGAGGQHVNKTESAIRLTHIPTGTVVSMQDERSQQANRRKAWQVLRAKIAEARQEAREQELVELRRGALGGVARMGRGDKIRTYNFGQSRCTDHRCGTTIHNLDGVLDGGDGLETVMENVRSWMVDREVEAMVAEDLAKANLEKTKKNGEKIVTGLLP
ncbi:hypothetical protein N7470_006743 [Penicillium chermesinum]|nr:hypothetical protein N7470_006743 [Penicillium chermesinum]